MRGPPSSCAPRACGDAWGRRQHTPKTVWPKYTNPISLFGQVAGSALHLSGHAFIAPPPSVDWREPGRRANRLRRRGRALFACRRAKEPSGCRGPSRPVEPGPVPAQFGGRSRQFERWAGGPRLAATPPAAARMPKAERKINPKAGLTWSRCTAITQRGAAM